MTTDDPVFEQFIAARKKEGHVTLYCHECKSVAHYRVEDRAYCKNHKIEAIEYGKRTSRRYASWVARKVKDSPAAHSYESELWL